MTANCRIPVTFQIKDRTKVAAEGASLNKTALNFTVTRKLTGDRKNPQETLTVSAPQILSGTFAPDYFDKKDINWTVGDHGRSSRWMPVLWKKGSRTAITGTRR